MKNNYDLIVFDWEGTLADTLGEIIHSVSKQAKILGFGDIDSELARNYVDLGLVKAVQKLLPELTTAQQEQLLNAVQQNMISKPSEVYLFPGAKEFVLNLEKAGVYLAIASNKSQQSLQRALQASALEDVFKVNRTASQAPAKPCPQMLEEIMAIYQVDPKSTLMIGDSLTDIEMAKNAGVRSIGVDFYHHQKEVLVEAGASMVFDNYGELADYLNLHITEG